MTVGNSIRSALSGQENQAGGDGLKKNLDVIKGLLLPHYAEDTIRKAEQARELLIKEVSKGPLKYTVVGGNQRRGRNRRQR